MALGASGELLALRAWRLAWWNEDAGPVLGSLTQGTIWDGPVLHSHRQPLDDPEGRAGIYALKVRWRPSLVPASYPDQVVHNWLNGPTTWVWGWVALSGQVVEHEFGYRAETAVIRRLHLGVPTHLVYERPEQLEQLVRDLEDRYQCPVKAGAWEARRAEAIRRQAADWLSEQPRLPFVPLATPRTAPRPATVAARSAPSAAGPTPVAPRPASIAMRVGPALDLAIRRLCRLVFVSVEWPMHAIAREAALILFRPAYAPDPAARFYDARRGQG